MPRGTRTDPQVAARVAALAASGEISSEIVKTTETAKSTVFDIVNKKGAWATIYNEQWFKQYMEEHKRIIAVGNAVVNQGYLMRMAETLKDVGGGTAIYGYGVTFDKGQIIAGEPTQIVETLSREAWDKQTDTLVEYYQEIGRRRATEKVVEVEVENEGEE